MNDETHTDAGNTESAEAIDVPESNPEAEMLRTENESLRQTLRVASARQAIVGALQTAGARSPELLFEAAKPELQFTDDGELANAAALVDRLQRIYPEQFGRETSQASIDGAAGQGGRSNYISKETLRQMTPAQIARLDWNDVKQVLSNGGR